MMKFWSLALVAMLAVVHLDADARRMGGGKSVGKQSSNVTQREAAPAAPAAPTQNVNNAAAAKPATAPNAAPAAAAVIVFRISRRCKPAWPGVSAPLCSDPA